MAAFFTASCTALVAAAVYHEYSKLKTSCSSPTGEYTHTPCSIYGPADGKACKRILTPYKDVAYYVEVPLHNSLWREVVIRKNKAGEETPYQCVSRMGNGTVIGTNYDESLEYRIDENVEGSEFNERMLGVPLRNSQQICYVNGDHSSELGISLSGSEIRSFSIVDIGCDQYAESVRIFVKGEGTPTVLLRGRGEDAQLTEVGFTDSVDKKLTVYRQSLHVDEILRQIPTVL